MFFGWEKVSERFHLAATWLTIVGATRSAYWILVANAWMQYPVGIEFNPDTLRNEMSDFFALISSPVVIYKFIHTVLSGWVTGAMFVIGISSWYLLKHRASEFSLKSIKVASIFGLIATVLSLWSGDGSAYEVAQKQPMKLAAMEALYEGGEGVGLVGFGILKPDEVKDLTANNPFYYKFEIPQLLSLLANRQMDTYVPGVRNLLDGGYLQRDGNIALSAEEKIEKGKIAIQALADYRQAKKDNNPELAQTALNIFTYNYPYFGYGYIKDPAELVPNVPMVFYFFRIMVYCGCFFLAFFAISVLLSFIKKYEAARWLQWIALLSFPLAYIAGHAGWIVAETGRQPWAIQDILPVGVSVSRLTTSDVKTTFFMFLIVFTVLLIAEIGIMVKVIKKGPETVIDESI